MLVLRTLAPALGLLLAAVPAVVPTAASADPARTDLTRPGAATSGPSVSGAERARAEAALAEVVDAFRPLAGTRRGGSADPRPRDVTLAMLQLQRSLDALDGEDRQLAERYLARPTDAGGAEVVTYDRAARPTSRCVEEVCVTWAQTTRDAPDVARDEDGNGVPDQVDLTLGTFASVWQRVVTRGGYRAPLPDAGPTRGEGPDRGFDVYLADIGARGLYGYCTTDQSPEIQRASSGFCVVDDDYAAFQFPANTPTENLQVTAAHEFFHAVQFAYDAAEDVWFMEGTAAWIEDELYDEVNDNLQYLVPGPLTRPRSSLDDADALRNPYSSWIWWRYLSERFPREAHTGLPTIIRDAWERAADSDPARPGTFSLRATAQAVEARGAVFRTTLSRFYEVNRHPRTFYDEGRSYPTAPLAATHRFSKSKRSVTSGMVLEQLSGGTVAFAPSAALSSYQWRLQVKVDAPDLARGSAVYVTLRRPNGTLTTTSVRLTSAGKGSVTVPFGSTFVRSIELTMTNGSTRYACDRDTARSCSGRPLDHQLRTAFSATLRQR